MKGLIAMGLEQLLTFIIYHLSSLTVMPSLFFSPLIATSQSKLEGENFELGASRLRLLLEPFLDKQLISLSLRISSAKWG